MGLRDGPFVKGESGRATMAAYTLLQGKAQAITRKAIELAKDGGVTALRMCLDRIARLIVSDLSPLPCLRSR